MPKSFPQVNLGAYFNDVWAPGAGPFSQALQYYQRDLRNNAAGVGEAQLTEAQANEQSGSAYANQPYSGNPTQGQGQEAGAGATAGLQRGQSVARTAGKQTKAQTQQGDISGATDTSQAFANSLTQYIQSQIALRNAQAQQAGSTLGQIMGGIDLAGGVAGEFVAPGNPFSTAAITGGSGQLLGQSQGNMIGGMAGPFSKMFSKGSGGSPNPPGYSPANANSFSPSSLPPWLDPSMITAYSGTGGPPSGFFSSLGFGG